MTPERITSLQHRFATVLEPLSTGYAWLMRNRANLYASGQRTSWRPPAPCISVGNISWGGTGKTPVVSWLLDWSREKNLHPAVLTRGYGGRPPGYPYEVLLNSSPHDAGDEPLLLKRTHPGARILVDPNRIRAGKKAPQETDLFLLDDGFQHLRVQRDLNLCLLSPRDLDTDWNRVIPAGSWREDLTALHRADAFLINIMFDDHGCLDTVASIKLAHLRRPIFFFKVVARGITNVRTGETIDSLADTPFILITGIANPEKVRKTCATDLGNTPVRHIPFQDHHPFTRADWEAMAISAERNSCSHIVCTPKDAVKLAPYADERLWVPKLSTFFSTCDEQPFRVWLDGRFHSLQRTTNASQEKTVS